MKRLLSVWFLALIFAPESAFAMHIADGILPAGWALFWWIVAAPFLWLGLARLKERVADGGNAKAFTGLVGSAIFIISCMPIPVPISGSTSHPCGTGIAAVLIGPRLTFVVASVALTLQAIFLAHGGFTTLGANFFSMGVMGGLVGYSVFNLGKRFGVSPVRSAFMAGMLSDWATYATTSLELSAALHGDGPFGTMFLAVLTAFVPTQLPLGIMEGFMSAAAFKFINERRPELFSFSSGKTVANEKAI